MLKRVQGECLKVVDLTDRQNDRHHVLGIAALETRVNTAAWFMRASFKEGMFRTQTAMDFMGNL